MKVVVYMEYGPPKVLRFQQMENPTYRPALAVLLWSFMGCSNGIADPRTAVGSTG